MSGGWSYAIPILLAVLLLGEKLWKYAMVVRFFTCNTERKARSTSPPLPNLDEGKEPLVSIIQPILSGDPTLAACLEHNLNFACGYPVEILWLVDTNDSEGLRICRDLIARYPGRTIHLLVASPPEDRRSPKMVKLIAGAAQAQGDILCVLDDDTMLPNDGLEICLPYLDRPGVGLAFGLPYYICFSNLWSSLVACFVNSHSLLTYIPCACLTEPFTINGMFFAVKRSALEAVGGFEGLETELMDDFAVAQRFRQQGYRLAQTPLRHGISTHVRSLRHYLNLLQRWFIFPRETLMKALPLRERAIAYRVTLSEILGPLLLLCAILIRPSLPAIMSGGVYLLLSFAVFAHLNSAYLRKATPWRVSGLVMLIQIILPLQLLAALISPQRIVWRGHVMQIEAGGKFRFVRRRTED